MATSGVITNPPAAGTVARRCASLIAVAVILWGLLAWPAWRLAGIDGLEGLSIAAGLCTVPGLLVFALSGLAAGNPTQAGWIVLGGTVIRLMFVLVGTLVVQAVQPHLRFREYLIWLVVFYLGMLLAETLMVVQARTPSEEGAAPKSPSNEASAGAGGTVAGG